MRPDRRLAVPLLALCALVALDGCRKKEEPSPVPVAAAEAPPVAVPATPPTPSVTATVTSIDLGKALGPDQRVAQPASAFARGDTIYAAVTTATSEAGAAVSGRLTARWVQGADRTVAEDTRAVRFAGAGVTGFQASKAETWPLGRYRLDVFLDGKLAASKDFVVK